MATLIGQAHQWRVKKFWEYCEITLVAGHGIDEVLNLLKHLFDRIDFTHLPLHRANPHIANATAKNIIRRLVQEVVPFQQSGKADRAFVLGQILTEQALDGEIVG